MSISRPEQHTSVGPDALPQHIQRVDEAFDKTSLGAAYSEGLVDNRVPDNAQDVIDIAHPESANFLEHPAARERISHRRRNLLIGTGAVVATGLVAGGAFLGLKAAAGNQTESSPSLTPETISSAPITPGESAAASPEVWTVSSLELPGTLTPEELGKTFVQNRLSAWSIVGATKENLDKFLGGGSDEALTAASKQNGAIIADALFVPGWQNDPALAKSVSDEEKINNATVELHFATDSKVSSVLADKEPYIRGITVESTSVTSQAKDTISISTAATEWDNSNLNTANAHITRAAAVNGNKIIVNTTFKLISGRWKISALSFVHRG